ncbi:TetR/AcrR family transcriptional regulator [Acinetobacter modestus]|uniref:TetR/AcrR family transcriptional regulator n=1 Tax=Acinetobacter modestus TaxID=1776740 RepID=UPI001F4A23C9|nr:TetR/AcrR family transcriptional regulator [Acinetobacter modestus]MCH7331556.1 TetR family transcriptional regulator [Acinetobacter modestus]
MSKQTQLDQKNSIANRSKAGKRPEVKARLMDVAEALFADHSFHSVSVRDITQAAGTRLADINELFGSKDILFREVIIRRASLINEDRLLLLSSVVISDNKEIDLYSIVQAFGDPFLKRSAESEGWRNYLRLLSQLVNTKSVVLLLIADYFNSIAEAFIKRISETLPHLNERQLLNTYQFMLSTMLSVFSENHRIDVLSQDRLHSSDFDEHYEDVKDFIVGGMLKMGGYTQTTKLR